MNESTPTTFSTPITTSTMTSNNNNNTIEIPANFKSTLPPRKRARTKEEKEQRRIERILRNRKAAHQSREKKRLHLKFLESKCEAMELILSKLDLNELFKNNQENLNILKNYNDLINSNDNESFRSSTASSPNKDNSDSSPAFTTSTSSSIPIYNKDTNGIDEDDSSIVKSEFQSPELNFDFQLKSNIDNSNGLFNSNSNSDSSSIIHSPISSVKFEDDEKCINYNLSIDEKNWNFYLKNDSVMNNNVINNNNNINNINNNSNDLIPSFDYDSNELNENSFDLDNWRNPAVITLY